MSDHWRLLAVAVVARRNELGLRQIDIPQRGGPSLDRVQAIEAGASGNYRPSTLSALETALFWEPGSVERVLAGGRPTVAVAADPGQGALLVTLERGRRQAVDMSGDMAAAYGYLLAVVDTVIQQLRSGGAA